jgi:hypothetical protein
VWEDDFVHSLSVKKVGETMRFKNLIFSWKAGIFAVAALVVGIETAHSMPSTVVVAGASTTSATILDPFAVAVVPAASTDTVVVSDDATDPFSGYNPPTKSPFVPPGRAGF